MSYRNRAAKPTALLWLFVALIELVVLPGTSLAVLATVVLALVATGWAARRTLGPVPARQPVRRGR
ncbi:MAG TPA: hypothetical protein VF054_04995 [Micromonosporaceae bacterium]